MFYVEQMAHLSVCYCIGQLWLLRTFFRENWVDSEVAGIEINRTHILASKCPNMEFFKQHFSFQLIRKAETILLPIM